MFHKGLVIFILSALCITLIACKDKEKLAREKEQETAKKMMEYKPRQKVEYQYF